MEKIKTNCLGIKDSLLFGRLNLVLYWCLLSCFLKMKKTCQVYYWQREALPYELPLYCDTSTPLCRSVVGVLGPKGDLVNRYSYDPYGRILAASEELPQDFKFIGQWGVTADRELRNIYWMRFRHYDAQLGRFLSFDPLGMDFPANLDVFIEPKNLSWIIQAEDWTKQFKIFC